MPPRAVNVGLIGRPHGVCVTVQVMGKWEGWGTCGVSKAPMCSHFAGLPASARLAELKSRWLGVDFRSIPVGLQVVL